MAEQLQFTDEQLKSAFDKVKGEHRASFEEDGTAEILRHLSNTVGRLQSAGADISIQVISGDHTSAYDMMYTVGDYKQTYGEINAYGFIKMGERQHLFAISSKFGEEAVSRLYLSKFNVHLTGGRATDDEGKNRTRDYIPGEMYDFKTDQRALRKLQERLINLAAQAVVVKEYDSENVFNRPAEPPTKPSAAKLKV